MGEARQYQARTLEVAVSKAARDLGVSMEALRYEVVNDGKRGLFGFGQRDVIIKVDVDACRQPAPSPTRSAGRDKSVGPVGDQFPEERRQAAPSQARPQAPRPHHGDPIHGGRGGGRRSEGGLSGEAGRGRDPRARSERGQPPRHEGRRPPAPRPPQTPLGHAAQALGSNLVSSMKLDLRCDVREEGAVLLELVGPDERLAIGRGGEVLDAFQHLMNRILARDPAWDGQKIAVDSGGYRMRNEREIEQTAMKIADEVRESGQSIELQPMNPYQRRIVHMTLKDSPGVKTFSSGEGFMRRLTIAPSNQT